MATKSTSAAASGAVVRRPSAATTVARKPAGRAPGKGMSSVLNFYTDDKPGLQMSPVLVVGISVGFIACVTLLHIIGKIRGL